MALVNGFQPSTNATKNSILSAARILDPPLGSLRKKNMFGFFKKRDAFIEDIFVIFVVAESLY